MEKFITPKQSSVFICSCSSRPAECFQTWRVQMHSE